MSVRPNSQCGRILAVLSDGQSHSTAELYRRLGGMVLHSRIAELRTHGYNVTCERLPGVKGAAGYIYRLTNPDREKASQRVTTVVDPSRYGREATTRRFNALRDEHRGGRPWPEERFECDPDESAGLADTVDGNGFSLPWEEVSGKTDPRERFSLYRLCDCGECGGKGKFSTWSPPDPVPLSTRKCPECRGEGKVRDLLATCETPEAVGVALVTLAREGEWRDVRGDQCGVGLLDSQGAKHERWLITPWLASPRNLSDAGKALRRAQR